jgi:hypothetical protein
MNIDIKKIYINEINKLDINEYFGDWVNNIDELYELKKRYG